MWFVFSQNELSVNLLVPAVQWREDEYFIGQRIARSGAWRLSEFAISYGRHDIYMTYSVTHDVSGGLHVVILSDKLPFTRKAVVQTHGYTLTDIRCRPNFTCLYFETIYDMDAATGFLNYSFKPFTHLCWEMFIFSMKGVL